MFFMYVFGWGPGGELRWIVPKLFRTVKSRAAEAIVVPIEAIALPVDLYMFRPVVSRT